MSPCTLLSVFFLCRKPGRESFRLPVCKAECRCCGSPARFSGSLSAGMPLPCLSAVHRHRQAVAVFQQLFEQGQQPVEIRVERLYPLMVLFSDFITHTRLILVYTLFLKLTQMVLPFQRASLRLSSTLPTTRSTSSGR